MSHIFSKSVPHFEKYLICSFLPFLERGINSVNSFDSFLSFSYY